MANDMGTLQFGIRYNVDTSGLDKVKSQLQELQNMNYKTFAAQTGQTGKQQEILQSLSKVKETASQVEQAMKKAFNPTLGGYNINVLNKELKSIGLDKIAKDFNSMGAQGKAMFSQLAAQATQLNTQLRQSHKILDDFATSMGNTIKWGITSSIMNSFTGSAQQAYGYIKNLDSSLNDIRIVTGKSAEEMDAFAVKANKAAQALGSSTLNYTKAALIYAQQGLDDEEIEARANITLKTANVTGQTGDAVSEQLTAVWNGYKVSAQEAELYVDKMAAVAVTTASDLQELSTGMQKVASAANLMGVDIDQLNAQLATVISTTRQAPETVGTAFKTIYARMSTINAGGTDEDGATLTSYTKKMDKFGISVLDTNGKLRDMGEVIEEIGDKWGQFTREQQISLAQVAAGTRQYGNLTALFDNWDKYKETLKVSASAAGTLNEQNSIYLESMTAHINQLQTANDNLMDSLFNADSFKGWIDAGTEGLKFLTNFVDAIGGGGNAFLALGSIATQVFSKNIASGISTALSNLTSFASNAKALTEQLDVVRDFAISNGANNQTTNDVINYRRTENTYSSVMTEEERSAYDERIKKLAEMGGAADQAAEAEARLKVQLEELSRMSLKDTDFKDASNGFLDAEKIGEALGSVRQNIEEAKNSLKSFEDISANVVKETTVGQFKESFKNIDIDNVKKSLEKLGQVYSKDSKELEDYTKKVEKYIEALKKQQEILNKVESNGHAGKQLHNAKADQTNVKEVYKETADAAKEMSEAVEQAQNQAEGAVQKLEEQSEESFHAIQEDARNTSRNYEEAKAALDKINEGLAQRAIIKSVVDTAGALGTLSSSILSIKNLGSIWYQKDIDTGTKILQTIQSLSFTIPSVVGAFNKLNQVYKTLQGIQKVNLLLNGQELTVTKSQIVQIGKKTFAEALSGDTEKKNAAIKKIMNTLSIDEAAAEELATQATIKHSVAQKALNASLLANPIGIILASIAGAIAITAGIINGVHEAQKAAAEMRNEYNDSIIEEAKSSKEQNATIEQTYKAYKKLENEYKIQNITKDELLKSTDEIIEAYDIENGKIMALTGNYEGLSKAIAQARKEKLEEVLSQSENAVIASEQKISDKSYSLDTGFLGFGGHNLGIYSSNVDLTNYKDATKFLNKVSQNTLSMDQRFTSFDEYGKVTIGFDIDESNTDNIVNLYDELTERLKTARKEGIDVNSESLMFVRDFLKDYKEEVEEYKALQKELEDSQINVAEDIQGLSYSKTFEDFNKNVDTFKNKLHELGVEEERINELTIQHIGTLNSSFAAKYLAINSIFEKFGKNFNEDISKYLNTLSDRDLSILISVGLDGSETSEQLQAILDAATQNVVLDLSAIEILSPIREKINSGKIKEKDIQEVIEEGQAYGLDFSKDLEGFTSLNKIAQFEKLDEIQNQINAEARKSFNEILQGSKQVALETTKNLAEEYKEQIKNNPFTEVSGIDVEKIRSWVDDVKNEDGTIDNDKLNKKRQLIKDKGEDNISKSEQEFLNVTAKNGRVIYEIDEITNGIDNLQIRIDELYNGDTDNNGILDGEDLKNTEESLINLQDEIQNTEEALNNFSQTQIQDTVFKQIEQSLDSVMGKTELFNGIISKIGEGFTMASSDVAKFAQECPALFEGMSEGEDGLMKLNEDAIKQFIQGEKDKLIAEAESQKIRAKNNLDLIEGQKAYLKVKIDSLSQVLTGEKSLDEATTEINKAAHTFLMGLDKDYTDQKINNEVLGVQANNRSTEQVLSNLNKQGEAINKVGIAYANALEGKGGTYESEEVSVDSQEDVTNYFQTFLNQLDEEQKEKQAAAVQKNEEYKRTVGGNEEEIAKIIAESQAQYDDLDTQTSIWKGAVISADAVIASANNLGNKVGEKKNNSKSVQKTDYDDKELDPFLAIDGKIKAAKLKVDAIQNDIKDAEEAGDWERVHTLKETLGQELELIENYYKEKEKLVKQDIEKNSKKIGDYTALSEVNVNVINSDGTVDQAAADAVQAALNKRAADAASAYDNAKNSGLDEEKIAELKLAYDNAKDDVNNFTTALKQYITDSTSTLPGIIKEIQDLAKSERLGKIDTFAEVDYQLNRINKDLSKLQKLQKGLNGEDLQKNLQKQIDLLNKRNKLLTAKKVDKQAELDTLRSNLERSFGHEGFKVNEDGTTTYQQTLLALKARAEKEFEDIQKASAENKSKYEEIYNKTVDEINDFMKQFSEYLAVQSAIDDIDDQLEDVLQQKIDAQISAFDAKIKLKLDLADAKRQWLEFKHEMTKVKWDIWGNDILDEARYNIEKFWTYPDSINTMLGGLNQITSSINTMKDGKTDSIFGDYTQGMEKAVSMSKEYRDKIMSDLKEAGATIEDIERVYLDMIDRASQTLGDHIKQFELINEIFEHNRKMITLTQGDKAYDKLAKYYDLQVKNNNAQIASLKEQADMWERRMNAATYGSEEWVKLRDQWEDTVSQLNSTIESSVENLIVKYENGVDLILQNFEKSLTGGSQLDDLQTEWDRLNQEADVYLDKINSAYEIEKLKNKYLDSIDNAKNDVAAQERLTKIMNEQVAALKEKDKLTQYDVDRANLLYEIELKKIALEESQANKSKMRLRRDSQGNYSYQYVGDDKNDDKKQELEDLQNRLYNMDKDQFIKNQNDILKLQQDYEKELAEIAKDATLTEEEKQKKILSLNEHYGKMINALDTENAVIKKNLNESTMAELIDLYGYTEDTAKNILMEEIVPQWDSGVQQMIDKMVADGGFGPSVEDTFNKISALQAQYQAELKSVADAAGISLDQLKNGYDGVWEAVQGIIDQSQGIEDAMDRQLNLAKQLADQAGILKQAWLEVAAAAEAAFKANDAAQNAPQKESNSSSSSTITSAATAALSSPSSIVTSAVDLINNNSSSNTNGKDGFILGVKKGALFNKTLSDSQRKEILGYGWVYKYSADKESINQLKSKGDYFHAIAQLINMIKSGAAYDTGGYTGEWGTEGRLAMLHQKELVLNAKDTENILNVVDIVRQMMNQVQNMNSSINSIGVQSSASTGQLEQNVHIEATFPNVSNANEVQSALENLVNTASQYAFRTGR